MTLAVVCPNLIGDTVMATPTFRALRERYPAERLIAVVRPSVSPVLDGCPWFDRRILADHRSKEPSHSVRSALRALRQERIVTMVLLPNSFRSALFAVRSGATRRVGYARGGRGFLLTDGLLPRRDRLRRFVPTPIIQEYLALARHLGCRIDSTRTELFTTAEEEQAADRAFTALGFQPNERVICLNSGGAFGPAKAWPEEHFAHLARRLARDSGVRVLVLCGPSERDAARAIVDGADHPHVVSLADQELSIGLSKACVRRSSLLVTTDSGPRHFATAFDVPVLTIFGPTHIDWTRTDHPLSFHIVHPVSCGPCQQPTCLQGHHRCLRDLGPEAVYQAASRILRGDLPESRTLVA
jgi:heptosyltransferase II